MVHSRPFMHSKRLSFINYQNGTVTLRFFCLFIKLNERMIRQKMTNEQCYKTDLMSLKVLL